MRVSEVGEFGLIELLATQLGLAYPPPKGALPRPGLVLDIGDDTVVSEAVNAPLIWTTDTLVAGVHFLPERTAWADTGWKALAVNLSDVAAMGGRPHLALVTLALPDDFAVEDASAMYLGLRAAAEAYGVTLGGGDIVRSPVFSITVALSGIASLSSAGEPLLLRRSAARPGDVIAVSGTLGDSAGGLRLLVDGDAFASPAARRLREAHEPPKPRLDVAALAVAAGLRCGIDVSDGLVQDLGHVARASGVRVRVEAARLPWSSELLEAFPDGALSFALAGGEDYELVLAGEPGAVDALVRSGAGATVIGAGEQGHPGVVVVDERGAPLALVRSGWDHLAPR